MTGDGAVLGADEVPTPRAPEGCDPGLRALAALAARLADTASAAGHRVVGIGVGFPEYVRGGAVSSAEVFAWDRQPADVLADVLPGVPVTVEGDVLCAAAAEAHARSTRPGSSLFYVSWGTGISSALVLGGVPFRGRRGEALALGEWPVAAAVDSEWPENLERYAAGLSLGRRYQQLTGAELDGRRGADGRAAAGHDPVAADIVDSAARAVAHALAQVVHLLDPDVVVLGGGLGDVGHPAAAVGRRAAPGPAPPAGPAPRGGGGGRCAGGPDRRGPAGSRWLGSPVGSDRAAGPHEVGRGLARAREHAHRGVRRHVHRVAGVKAVGGVAVAVLLLHVHPQLARGDDEDGLVLDLAGVLHVAGVHPAGEWVTVRCSVSASRPTRWVGASEAKPQTASDAGTTSRRVVPRRSSRASGHRPDQRGSR